MRIAWGLAAVALTTDAADSRGTASTTNDMNTIEIIEHWLQQIERIPTTGYVAIPDFASFNSRTRTGSVESCRQFLSPAANPHSRANKARCSYHPADDVYLDLLRHEFVAVGHSLIVYEGVNFIMVRLVDQKLGPWKREYIEAFVRWAINMSDAQHQWLFQYPETIAADTLISTAPMVDPSKMGSWRDRADVMIHHGELYVIGYKRYPPTLGFRHDAQWFEDELRPK